MCLYNVPDWEVMSHARGVAVQCGSTVKIAVKWDPATLLQKAVGTIFGLGGGGKKILRGGAAQKFL